MYVDGAVHCGKIRVQYIRMQRNKRYEKAVNSLGENYDRGKQSLVGRAFGFEEGAVETAERVRRRQFAIQKRNGYIFGRQDKAAGLKAGKGYERNA